MATLLLPARLTHLEAQTCLQALQRQAAAAETSGSGDLLVDASALVDFDSAALATLLALRRWALGQGGAMRLQRVPPRLAELVALYGVGELLSV